MTNFVDMARQVIKASVVDHLLEPDAMRGSEHYLRNITDGDGQPIAVEDQEQARRETLAKTMRPDPNTPLATQPNYQPAQMRPADPPAQLPTSSITEDTPMPTPLSWQKQAELAGWQPASDPNTQPPVSTSINTPESSSDTPAI